MSKTAWFAVVVIFALMFGNMAIFMLVNQKPIINTFTIKELEFTSTTGNFTMADVKLEIPSRSLDWLPLVGITLRQNSY